MRYITLILVVLLDINSALASPIMPPIFSWRDTTLDHIFRPLAKFERSFVDRLYAIAILIKKGEYAKVEIVGNDIRISLPLESTISRPETLTRLMVAVSVAEKVIMPIERFQSVEGFENFYKNSILGFALCYHKDLYGQDPQSLIPKDYNFTHEQVEAVVKFWRHLMSFDGRTIYMPPLFPK